MAIKNLETLLSEYEQKRRKAEMDLEKRKQELYEKFPRLEELDNIINQTAINKTKAILSNKENLEQFDFKMNQLKKEKEEFWKNNNIDLKLFEPEYECNICKDTGYIQGKKN